MNAECRTQDAETEKFEPSIDWLNRFLVARACAIRFSESYDCWQTIGWAVRQGRIPAALVDEGTAALIASGNGLAAYCYCRFVADRADVRTALIASGNGPAAYCYCRDVADRADVRALITGS